MYRFYHDQMKDKILSEHQAILSSSGDTSILDRETPAPSLMKLDWRKYLAIFRLCWPQLFNVFFVYVISLSLFPAVCADIVSTENMFPQKYFAPILCFLSFNLFAMFGNLCCTDLLPWLQVSPKKLWIPVVARIIFIPFFLFCNYAPDKR